MPLVLRAHQRVFEHLARRVDVRRDDRAPGHPADFLREMARLRKRVRRGRDDRADASGGRALPDVPPRLLRQLAPAALQPQPDLVAQRIALAVFAAELGQQVVQRRQIHRLEQKIRRAELQRPLGILEQRIGRDEHDLRLRRNLPHDRHHLQPIHVRHPNVRQHDIDLLRGNHPQDLLPVGRGQDLPIRPDGADSLRNFPNLHRHVVGDDDAHGSPSPQKSEQERPRHWAARTLLSVGRECLRLPAARRPCRPPSGCPTCSTV